MENNTEIKTEENYYNFEERLYELIKKLQDANSLLAEPQENIIHAIHCLKASLFLMKS